MNGGKTSITLKIGWILLTLVGTLLALGGLGSFYNAYSRGPDPMANVDIERLRELSPDLPTILRGRRATAAAFSFATGVLLVWIAVVPYRRGERWAWQAVGTSVAFAFMLSLLRMPMLDTRVGAGVAGVGLTLTLLALAVSYKDMK